MQLPFTEPISEHIWNTKYRYRINEHVLDETIEQTWQRVAQAIAQVEKPKEQKVWTQKFYDLLANFRFLPGGRILSGAGTERKVTLFNCFAMGTLVDSLEGIFDGLKEAVLTLQVGGGVGYDFSTLRPRGVSAKSTGTRASGPVSFMQIWDSMCATMQSTGARRGAMMGVLRCDHPDIEEFIHAKSEAKKLSHFNISVFISDAFMQAVHEDDSWALVFPLAEEEQAKDGEILYKAWPGYQEKVPCLVHRYISARKLWQQIIRSAYDHAEPGVLFEDTINRANNLWYRETIHTTNPCGEVPLPAYGACDLGSLNLTQFIRDAFTEHAKMEWHEFEEATSLAVRFLDNVVDLSLYPLEKQKTEAVASRRIGLGITGLADALVMLGMTYGSDSSLQFVRRIMQTLSHVSWLSSADLAKERGSFPAFMLDLYLQGSFVQSLPDEMRKIIQKRGMRNSHHNVIAPAGSISLLANNVSSGLEPIFNATYERTTKNVDDTLNRFKVTDFAFKLWQSRHSPQMFPPGWVDAQSLLPEDHLRIQAVSQPFIDGAISKTIFIPENFPFVQMQDVYEKAYQYGLKGCTLFRPNPITGSVLTEEQ